MEVEEADGGDTPVSSPSINSNMQPFQNVGDYHPTNQPRANNMRLNGPEDKVNLIDMNSNGFSCPAPLSCQKIQQRIVTRDSGRSRVVRKGIISSNWTGFITDSFTTVVNTPWYMICIIFIISYVLCWIVFGGLWLMAAKVSGTTNNQTETCLHDVTDFSSALIFSVETQVTIGYGNNYVANDCTLGLFLLIIQCLLGLIMDAFLLGLIFTKLTRPRNRRKTILFSQQAVLCQEDETGDRYLEFRIGNLRKSQIAECHVRLVLYWNRKQGDKSVFEQHDLACGYENGTDRLVLLMPVIVRHKIDESSPLWDVSPLNIEDEELEVVVVLEGVVEATGLTLQALWSYTADEVVCGRKLESIVTVEDGHWVIHFNKFDDIARQS